MAFCCCRAGVQVFCFKLLIKVGAPLEETFRDNILGLHNDWCANFTAFTRVRTECVKVENSPHVGVFTISKGGCRAQAIQGPLVAGLILLLGLQNWILGRSAAVLAAGLRWGLWGGPINQCWGICTLLK